HADQFALDRRGGEPLVPQSDGEFGEFGKIAGEGAGRLRPWALAGVHVDGQPEHETHGIALGGDGEQARRVGLEGLALNVATPVASRRSGSDTATPMVLVPRSSPTSAPRSGQCVTASINGRMRAGMAPHNTRAAIPAKREGR